MTKRDLTIKDFLGTIRWIVEHDGGWPSPGGHRERSLIELWEKRLKLPTTPMEGREYGRIFGEVMKQHPKVDPVLVNSILYTVAQNINSTNTKETP